MLTSTNLSCQAFAHWILQCSEAILLQMRNWAPKTHVLLVTVRTVHGVWAQLCFNLCPLFFLVTCWAQIRLSSIHARCSMWFIMLNSWFGQEVPACELYRWGKNLGRFNCQFLKVPQGVLADIQTPTFLLSKTQCQATSTYTFCGCYWKWLSLQAMGPFGYFFELTPLSLRSSGITKWPQKPVFSSVSLTAQRSTYHTSHLTSWEHYCSRHRDTDLLQLSKGKYLPPWQRQTSAVELMINCSSNVSHSCVHVSLWLRMLSCGLKCECTRWKPIVMSSGKSRWALKCESCWLFRSPDGVWVLRPCNLHYKEQIQW